MYNVVSAEYLDFYYVKIKFEDNSEGIVDFSEYKNRKGLFEAFKDIDFFKNF